MSLGRTVTRHAAVAGFLTLSLLVAGCSGDGDPGASGSTSAAPAVLAPTPSPEITGEARNGEILTGHAGTWGPGEVTLSYRWLRDGSPIQGAVEDTYELANGDVGHQVTVEVTGTKAGFPEVQQVSPPVGPVLKAILRSNAPMITGEAVFGQTVTVGDLDWGSEEVRFRYQWLRDGYAVPGATRRGYRLGLDDLGHVLTVEVTGRLRGFDDAVERSGRAGPVRTADFASAPRPRLTGTPRYYDWLTVPDPGWQPRPAALTYQWFRDGTLMRGITAASYQLHGRDIGHRITVQVTGARAGYTTTQRVSATRGPVKEGLLDPSPRPTIRGSVAVDRYLTVAAGSWGPVPVAIGWQWYRGGKPIKGAVDSSYLLTVDDLGQPISVRAVAEAQYFEARTRDAVPTARVAPGELSRTPTPLYSGVAQVGETITALPKEWGPGEVTLAYQWFRGKDRIAGATKVRYVVVAADKGKRLRVRVTGSQHGYRPAAQMSGWTGRIAPGVLIPGLPTLTGLAVEGETLTADGGGWGPGWVPLTYEWFSDGLPIADASGSTYTLSDVDVGHVLNVRVTGTKPGYTTAQAWSPTTEPVVGRAR